MIENAVAEKVRPYDPCGPAARYEHLSTAGHPQWLASNLKKHIATLRLIAGYKGAFNGFNFDGYGKGSMVVVMPVGFHVHVLFSNKGTYPHSAVIT